METQTQYKVSSDSNMSMHAYTGQRPNGFAKSLRAAQRGNRQPSKSRSSLRLSLLMTDGMRF